MFGSSRCQILNIINLWRAVSVIYLLYNSSINIGVAANKNMFNNNVQTLSCSYSVSLINDFGIQPPYLGKWKTTSIFKKMEDVLNLKENGRQPQFEGKWKVTSIF